MNKKYRDKLEQIKMKAEITKEDLEYALKLGFKYNLEDVMEKLNNIIIASKQLQKELKQKCIKLEVD